DWTRMRPRRLPRRARQNSLNTSCESLAEPGCSGAPKREPRHSSPGPSGCLLRDVLGPKWSSDNSSWDLVRLDSEQERTPERTPSRANSKPLTGDQKREPQAHFHGGMISEIFENDKSRWHILYLYTSRGFLLSAFSAGGGAAAVARSADAASYGAAARSAAALPEACSHT